jgi:hypothetical protein
MASKPTQRSLQYLRDQGWTLVQVVEKWVAQARRHIDLYGFADILAMHPVWGHLYVQTTSYSNVSARLKKIQMSEPAGVVLDNKESRIQIHGWHKVKGRWVPRIVDVTLERYYNMEQSEWESVYRLLSTAYSQMQHELVDGIFEAKADLCNYPPKIVIEIKQSEAGTGDQRSTKLTKKELVKVSEMAMEMTLGVLDYYPYLTMVNHAAPVAYGKAYVIKPKDYKEAAKISLSLTS